MRSRGFTLIELVITIAIVALLASVALPVTDLAVQRTREQELRRTLRQIRDAIDAYKQASDEGRVKKSVGDSGYPKKLEELAEGVEDQKRSEEHTSELQSLRHLVCRLLLEKKKEQE